jgi:hypothetical protein
MKVKKFNNPLIVWLPVVLNSGDFKNKIQNLEN